MMTWLTANLGTILISLLLLGVVAAIVFRLIKKRKKGQSSCGCDCASCGCGCGGCKK